MAGCTAWRGWHTRHTTVQKRVHWSLPSHYYAIREQEERRIAVESCIVVLVIDLWRCVYTYVFYMGMHPNKTKLLEALVVSAFLVEGLETRDDGVQCTEPQSQFLLSLVLRLT